MRGSCSAALGLLAAGQPLSPQAQGRPRPPRKPLGRRRRIPAGRRRRHPRIGVFQSPDLTLETRVAESGVVSPLLGNVKLGGLTVNAAEKLIADGLRNGNFLRQPQVSIVVLQVRATRSACWARSTVRAATPPIELAETCLSDMLAQASGTAPTAPTRWCWWACDGNRPLRLEMDLPTLSICRRARQRTVPVANGDTIWVDRQPLVYIYGEVQRPGPMRLERG